MSAGHQNPGLERANHNRLEQHRLKQMVRAPRNKRESRGLLADLLPDPPLELYRLTAFKLLLWSWRMDEDTAKRLLYAAGASMVVMVGQLTNRQRARLAILLRADNQALKDAEMERLRQEMPWQPWRTSR